MFQGRRLGVQSHWVSSSCPFLACLVSKSAAIVNAALCGDYVAAQIQGLRSREVRPAWGGKSSASMLLRWAVLVHAGDKPARAAVCGPQPHSVENQGWGSCSEWSPSDISKVPPVSEKDDVHLGVEKCCNDERLPLASLQENTEAPFTKPFFKDVILLNTGHFQVKIY